MALSHDIGLSRFSAEEAWLLSMNNAAPAEPTSRDLQSRNERLVRAEAEAQAAIDRLEGRSLARSSSASSVGPWSPASPSRRADEAVLQRAAAFLLSSSGRGGRHHETKQAIGPAPFSRFQANGGGSACVICLQDISRSEFTEGSTIYITPCAGRHVLHRACAEEWFVNKDACPTCREHVPKNYQPRMPTKQPSRRGKSAPRPKFGTEAHRQLANERGSAENLSKIMRSLELSKRSSKRK